MYGAVHTKLFIMTQTNNNPSFLKLGTLFQQRAFTSLNDSLGINESGYPFLTLRGKNQSAQNVYFTKNAANILLSKEGVDVFDNVDNTKLIGKGLGFKAGSKLGKMLAELSCGLVANDQGEPRFKLTLISKAMSVAELNDIFGTNVSEEEEVLDFDYKLFDEGFTTVADRAENAEEVKKQTLRSIADLKAELSSTTAKAKQRVLEAKIAKLEETL